MSNPRIQMKADTLQWLFNLVPNFIQLGMHTQAQWALSRAEDIRHELIELATGGQR